MRRQHPVPHNEDTRPLLKFKCEVCGKESGSRDKNAPKLCARHYGQRRRHS